MQDIYLNGLIESGKFLKALEPTRTNSQAEWLDKIPPFEVHALFAKLMTERGGIDDVAVVIGRMTDIFVAKSHELNGAQIFALAKYCTEETAQCMTSFAVALLVSEELRLVTYPSVGVVLILGGSRSFLEKYYEAPEIKITDW